MKLIVSYIPLIRRIITLVMLYITCAFPIRYPTDALAFTYLTFLCSLAIEIGLYLAPILGTDLIQKKWFQVLFQCSWVWNFAVTFTTLLFFLNPKMIKDLNLPSTAALVEMLLMHYTPVLIHLIHLYEYPRLYKERYFVWTLIFPMLYYVYRNDILYFRKHAITATDLVKQNIIVVTGPLMQYLAQAVGVWLHRLFFPLEKGDAKVKQR